MEGNKNPAKEVKDSIPVKEEETSDNYNKGVEELFPPPPANDDCTCVPFYLCLNNTNILNEDGEGIIDIKFVSSPPPPSRKRFRFYRRDIIAY